MTRNPLWGKANTHASTPPVAGDLESRVRGSAKLWRRCAGVLDALERDLIADGRPASAVAALAVVVREELQRSVDALRLFGVDVETRQWGPPTMLLRPGDEDRFLRAAVHFIIAWASIEMMGLAGRTAEQRGEVPARAMGEAFLTVWRTAPMLQGYAMVLCADPDQQDRAIVGLSGWLALRVSPTPRPDCLGSDLRAALTEEGAQFWPTLCERLPGALARAWHELPPAERVPRRLLNHATNLLRREGWTTKKVRRADGGNGGYDYQAVPVGRLPQDGLAASRCDVEDAALASAELRELLERAKNLPRGQSLSRQQQDILELKRQDLSDADIARCLDTTAKNVKTQWAKTCEKLRRAG